MTRYLKMITISRCYSRAREMAGMGTRERGWYLGDKEQIYRNWYFASACLHENACNSCLESPGKQELKPMK